MATPKGIIGFQGTIGGISFYMRKGKPCARKAGGPSKETVATSKKCKRTRENNAEFKGAVAASKLLRLGLNQFIKNFADWNISGRLNGVFRKIIDRANGLRGERPIEILPNKDLLMGFNLNKEISFDSIFQAPFISSINTGRNKVTIIVQAFDITRLIHSPTGATHFRIVNAIAVVPKFEYNALFKGYVRIDGMTKVSNAHSFSNYIAISSNVNPETIIIAELPDNPSLDPDNSVICCLGIEFYQEVGGNNYLLESGNVMKIANIY